MQLLPMMPQGNYAWVWLIFHHLFQASTIILSHVILNSDPTVANEDLDLIKLVLGLLKGLVSWFTGFLYFVLYFTPLILTLIT
jgi:hypothetical protein